MEEEIMRSLDCKRVAAGIVLAGAMLTTVPLAHAQLLPFCKPKPNYCPPAPCPAPYPQPQPATPPDKLPPDQQPPQRPEGQPQQPQQPDISPERFAALGGDTVALSTPNMAGDQ